MQCKACLWPSFVLHLFATQQQSFICYQEKQLHLDETTYKENLQF